MKQRNKLLKNINKLCKKELGFSFLEDIEDSIVYFETIQIGITNYTILGCNNNLITAIKLGCTNTVTFTPYYPHLSITALKGILKQLKEFNKADYFGLDPRQYKIIKGLIKLNTSQLHYQEFCDDNGLRYLSLQSFEDYKDYVQNTI